MTGQFVAATGRTGSEGAVDDSGTSHSLPGGGRALHPGGDMRLLAASLPSLVRQFQVCVG